MGSIADATDKQLEDYRQAIVKEQERRRIRATAEEQMNTLSRQVLEAKGAKPGDSWVQPTDATNAYPKNWEVFHGAKRWVSLVSGNVWEPGVSAWREIVTAGALEWVQPTGAHDAYNVGDRVTFEGTVFESVIDGNVWSPTAHPAGWKTVPGLTAQLTAHTKRSRHA